MDRQRLGIACAVAAVLLCHDPAWAQQIPRTPDGKPDLQGMWLNDTATPLERPAAFAGKATLTDAEARAYEQRYQLDRTAAATRVNPVFELDVAGDLDTYEPGTLLPGNRTSMITDPADGRVPALTPAAQQRQAARTEHLRVHYGDNPEDFTYAERCIIVASTSLPPMLPAYYNNQLQIVQTPAYVMIASEMIHDVRIIPLDGRAHPPSGIMQWKGHSTGRWDGDTLVVDTTNFTEKTAFRGSSTTLHVVERFSLNPDGALKYQFTLDDPASFTRPFSGDSRLTRTNDGMFEYACHEANHSIGIMLRGYRFGENNPTKD